jgi:hypothetical protein
MSTSVRRATTLEEYEALAPIEGEPTSESGQRSPFLSPHRQQGVRSPLCRHRARPVLCLV